MKGTLILHQVPWLEVEISVDNDTKIRCELSAESREMISNAVYHMSDDIKQIVQEAIDGDTETFCLQVYPAKDDSEETNDNGDGSSQLTVH